MKTFFLFLFIVLLTFTIVSAQTVLWSYKANGSLWEHIRSIKNIDDVNGDGHQDVIAVSENDTLYCLSGIDGVPIWKFVSASCYLERGLISVPDLNGDSIPDVVLATIWGTRSVFALSGANGDTIWQYDTHEYGSGGWVYEVAPMTDIDGDNIIDILASTGADPNRAYLFSGATGVKIWETNLGYAVFGIREIGDLNGDSIPDVAIGTGDGSSSTYNVFALDGFSGSQIWKKRLTGAGWTVLTIGDLNSDNIPDVISGNSAGVITAISGADSITLWTMNTGGNIVDLNVLYDVNENGFNELLPSGTTMNSFYCIDTDGITGNILWSTPAPDQVFASVRIPDINGDGKDDVACGTGYNVNVFFTLDGTTGDTIWYKNMSGPIESCWWIEDIDGNAYPDILVGTRDGWIYALSDGNVDVKEQKIEKPTPCTKLSVEPNPSIEKVVIRFSVSGVSGVDLNIYSVSGEKVFTPISGIEQSGSRKIVWDRKDAKGQIVPAGIYFVKLDAGIYSQTAKIVLIR